MRRRKLAELRRIARGLTPIRPRASAAIKPDYLNKVIDDPVPLVTAPSVRSNNQKRQSKLKLSQPVRSENLKRGPVCKERPKAEKGSGASREFVPWCDRKK